MPAFVWSASAWFGAQIGSTLWLLLLGVLLFRRDGAVAALCFACFAASNTWGGFLWSRRATFSTYAGFQRLLGAVALFTAAVVVTVNLRGLSQGQESSEFVSTHLPYWAIGIVPAMMLVFAWRERAARSLRP